MLLSPPERDKMIAWGGTAADDPEDGNGVLRRVWFYDFSAGPDGWTENWDVEGAADIIPNSWEYADEDAREPDELTFDLARLARYVAIGTLFAPSPLYPVGLTAPSLPEHIEFDVNDYDRDAGPIARRLDLAALPKTFEAVAPWLEFSVDLDPVDFANPGHAACYPGWVALVGPSCSPTNTGYFSAANLFLHHAANRPALFDNPKAYEAGGFVYPSPGPLGADCFGVAEDDFTTGTQSFVYVAGTPTCDSRIGFTAFLIHEYGHHIGLSHPHDGYDSELEEEFSGGLSPFIWAGTEVNSEMSYVGLNDEFSQFDQDNLARWWTEAYLTEANRLAELALAARVPTSAFAEADRLAGQAASRLANHEYLGAVAVAKSAFERVRSITRAAGVEIPAPLPEPSAGIARTDRAHPGAIDHVEPGTGYRR